MLVVLRLRWAPVDEAQWEQLCTMLNSQRLAAHGCLSWHSRRYGEELRVSALWDDHYAARIFVTGRLVEAVRAVGLDSPDLTRVTMPGTFLLGHRPAA